MKTKKLIGLLVVVGLIAAVGIGSTLAYFTSKDSKQNTFTLGNVGITLSETTGNSEPSFEGLVFDNLLPGQIVSKKPVVTVNDNSQPCYIRIKLGIAGKDNEAGITNLDMEALEDGLALDSNWTSKTDGYYYYKIAVNPGSATTNLFDHVKIPSTWGNATAGQTVIMNIQAEAVQSDYSTSIIDKDATGNVTKWNLTKTETDDLGITP